eukprot:TRINITY_DN25319_c0_g1_i1.p1 TRINITY_DN25319_c0_g1~~TRINITY_DN25319_c0_g1_i1.p1  ORF type:complete len:362 (+),score=27.03 TRINITY_DN25319_c0_g1_i1:294-1379(+)
MALHRSCAKLFVLFVPALADIHWVTKDFGGGCTRPSLTHLFDGADSDFKMPNIINIADQGVKDLLGRVGYFNDGLLSRNGTRSETGCVGKVPRNVHFVWVGHPLSTDHARNALKFATLNPSWTVFFWLDQKLSDAAADVMKPVADRLRCKIIREEAHRFVNRDLMCAQGNYGGVSDLLKIEAVYQEGGMYSDFDVSWYHPLAAYGGLFEWPFETLSWSTGVGCPVFGFDRHSPFLEFLIKAARENCKTFQRCGVMSEAGNGVHSAAILVYGSEDITLIDKADIAFPLDWAGPDVKDRIASDAHEGAKQGGWYDELAKGKSHPDVGFCVNTTTTTTSTARTVEEKQTATTTSRERRLDMFVV